MTTTTPSIVWLDPINRDAQSLKLLSGVAARQCGSFSVITTNRGGVELDPHVSFQPFFAEKTQRQMGPMSLRDRLSTASSYYKGYIQVADQLSLGTSVLYSSGMTLPEMEAIGLRRIKGRAAKLTMLVHNLEDVQSRFPNVSRLRSNILRAQFDEWIFLSDYVRAGALERWALEPGNTHVMLHPHFHPMLYNVEVDSTFASQLQEAAGGRPILAYISRLDQDHGIDLYYQILRQLGQQGINVFGVVLGRLGRAWDLKQNKQAVERYGLGTSELMMKVGWYDYGELLALLHVTDGVLAPYRRITQSAAIALALGERVPVIASRVGANPEMVKDSINGLLFDVANIDALVLDIAEVYKAGHTLRSRLVNDGFDISHLDPNRAVSEMLEWLKV